ncbi:MAG TPA: PQQ-dependent sugar dehydrogenase [Chitinophagales bacterium]|nr:PQQ-dependent sugar dehydrogenase [Chitinophagales bacterium]
MKRYSLAFLLCFVTGISFSQALHISLEEFSAGYNSPVDIENCGDGRLFIVQQNGYIYICDSAGNKNPTAFLDVHTLIITSSEQGLLGLAFDPDYASNRTFYIYYTHIGGSNNITIARYKTDSLNPNHADAGSAEILMSIPHPNYYNHDGGCIKFGPDGYLYFGTGDGGSGGDPDENAQNHAKYLGKLIRIDVDTASGYKIPSDNPFLDDASYYPELWAIGMRNPWRFSWDYLTGDLWIGDVGQNLWEEVDFMSYPDTGGQNYGWDCYEATHNYEPNNCNGAGPVTWSIGEYYHHFGDNCIIGGYVYRGAQYQSMFGKYFFTDNGSGKFRMITHNNDGTFTVDSIGDNLIPGDAYAFTGFGEDRYRELYVADASHGKIYHLKDTACTPAASIIEHWGSDSLSCVGTPMHALYGSNLSYQWLQDGVEIPGATDFSYSPLQAGVYTVQVTGSSGCSSTSSGVLAVDPTPASIVGLDSSFCIYQSAIPLFGDPTGGSFSGAGVSDSLFNPNIAGEGFHTVYYYYTNELGCIAVDSQVVRVDLCSGLNDDWDHTGVNIFPNPNDGSLSLILKDTNNAIAEVSIYNMAGQMLFTLSPDQNVNAHSSVHFNLSDLSNGVYEMRIVQGENVRVHKIVISH